MEPIFRAHEKLSDKDGVLVERGTFDGQPSVRKSFTNEHRREVDTYALLAELGVPTLKVLGSGADWIALEDVASSPWRLATEADMADVVVARHLAQWYVALHTAGRHAPLEDLYCEYDRLTPAQIDDVARCFPDLALALSRVKAPLEGWLQRLRSCELTLTYNDFWYVNAVVARDGSAAMMFDLNLLGAGYRWADIRNVCAGLRGAAPAAFQAEYARRAGVDTDPTEQEIDEPLSHLVCVVEAAQREVFPAWADDSRRWLLDNFGR